MKFKSLLGAAGGFTAAVALTTGIALSIVKDHEGLSLRAYQDSVGIQTICHGHTGDVKPGQRKTLPECNDLLNKDLAIAQSEVERLVKVPLTPERHAALSSFVFNVGAKKLASSTLLKKLNSGDTRGACEELSRWVYAGKEKLRGLVRRRAVERQLCEVGL